MLISVLTCFGARSRSDGRRDAVAAADFECELRLESKVELLDSKNSITVDIMIFVS